MNYARKSTTLDDIIYNFRVTYVYSLVLVRIMLFEIL